MSSSSIPSSWYFVVESKEVQSGQVIRKEIFGGVYVIWRSESGVLRMSSAVCPHLGSDLGKLGQVKGESLQCFSHDYTYNTDGDIIATGSREIPCKHKQAIKNIPIHETSGFILAWYDEDGYEPEWKIPDDVFSDEGTSKKYVRSEFVFNIPIHVLNEDNFDVGHIYKWHNVTDIESTPVEVDGPRIAIAHNFKRHSILFEKPLNPPFDFLTRQIVSRYSSNLYGHGLTASYIDIFNLGVHLQDMIWCTPITSNKLQYTTFLRRVLPKGPRSPLQTFADTFIQPLIFWGSVWRLRQEHKHEGHGFWENQTFQEDPILTKKERELIEPYRKWCKQFEPSGSSYRALRPAAEEA